MKYVIRNLDTGKWAARFGGEHSYTNNLQHAQTFSTLEAAQAHCCGNERILSLEDAVESRAIS
jgi:hypothetical protein